MGKSDFPTDGYYLNNLPKHRFVDFSKANLNSTLLVNRDKWDAQSAVSNGVNITMLEKDKKLEMLKPSTNQKFALPAEHAFPQRPRPELWPVLEEHKSPCTFL